MHGDDFVHEHPSLTAEDREAIVAAIDAQDSIELLTVGMDVGSSTSHLMFARIRYERDRTGVTETFSVVDRRVVWLSPIMLTPFLPDGTIDAASLSEFVRRSYAEAGITTDAIDSGAVILTGEAIKRKNARAINEMFAQGTGKFVCATAGHKLECILAAHGSGAIELSRRRSGTGLHVDIGGGTTKLALIREGEIVSVSAFAVGGRLVAQDAIDGTWSRIDESAELVAKELGIPATPAAFADPAARERLSQRMGRLVVDQIVSGPSDDLGRSLQLIDVLERPVEPEYLTFSGGVAEYIFGHEAGDYGDIAGPFAAAIVEELGRRVEIPALDVGQRIRATVIGASQFTVQVSGRTVYVNGDLELPIRNVPVVPLTVMDGTELNTGALVADLRGAADLLGVDPRGRVAFALSWKGSATHLRLSAVAAAIKAAADVADPESDNPLLVVIDADIAKNLGRVLTIEHGLRRRLLCLDGIELKALDFVDVGTLLDPPGVYPVVIKSLLFQ